MTAILTPRGQEPAAGQAEGGTPPRVSATGLLKRHVAMPIFLALALAALLGYVASRSLDVVERRSLNAGYLLTRVVEHVELTVAVAAVVVVIAVPAGIVLTRPRLKRVATPLVGVANIGQAVPSIGVLVLLALTIGIGARIAVAAFALYTILPVLRNTTVGLQQVDPSLLEAARGMGMSRTAVLVRVELPLAVPVILAGIRTALVISVGTVALATFVNAGGLGDVINNGITTDRPLVTLTGSALTAILALLVDWIAGIGEDVLRPRGL